MHEVLLLGGGKIGQTIARLLCDKPEFRLTVADTDPDALDRVGSLPGVRTVQLDATDDAALAKAVSGRQSVVSALSFYLNPNVAKAALAAGASYFDLTEDRATTNAIVELSNQARPGQIFMPQCGLAPGFVSVVAYDLFQQLDVVHNCFMRVGALPQFPSNSLKYNLTWSTDGLINEYCNMCECIREGETEEVLPLEGLEHFSLDGVRYEAFNTSGGLGTLCETLQGRVQNLNYKTIRYVGHRDLMAFLINGLRLGKRRDVLKDVLENAVPITDQDVVVVFCTVSGLLNGRLVQKSDARKIYQSKIGGETYSAIQVTTAAGLCTMLDLHHKGVLPESGFVRQEAVTLGQFLRNRFGRVYASSLTALPTIGAAQDEEPVPPSLEEVS